jgi:DNA recombination protein RmuC
VVLFIPGEAFLAPALERDPALLEHAMSRRVHIATPTTLVTMLRTAQYAWQQEALSQNARAVFDLGRELHSRIAGLGRHVDQLGRSLTRTVQAYNQTVGSLESRVLVSARRLNQLGVVDAELDTPVMVDEVARGLSAAELTEPIDGRPEPFDGPPEPFDGRPEPIASPASKPGTESPEIRPPDPLVQTPQWT